jgi:hypothetical protein
MSTFTVHTDTGRAFALTNEADAVRVALALVRGGHAKHARARLTGGWTYHANGGGFPDCWHSGNQYRTYPGDVPGTSRSA